MRDFAADSTICVRKWNIRCMSCDLGGGGARINPLGEIFYSLFWFVWNQVQRWKVSNDWKLNGMECPNFGYRRDGSCSEWNDLKPQSKLSTHLCYASEPSKILNLSRALRSAMKPIFLPATLLSRLELPMPALDWNEIRTLARCLYYSMIPLSL